MEKTSRAKKVIAFYPELSIILGDISSAIYYQQLFYWSDKGEREDGFIYKTQAEIEEETTITRKVQDRIRKSLENNGWIEVKKVKVNGSPILHYKCLVDIWVLFIGGNVPKGQMETPKRDISNVPNREVPILYTENTTKNTTERLQHLFDKEIQTDNLKEKTNFLSYWTEKNTDGKKERWQKQETFDVKRRWGKWLDNCKEWKKEETKKPYYDGFQVVEKHSKKYVIVDGEWKQFAGDEKDIVWK